MGQDKQILTIKKDEDVVMAAHYSLRYAEELGFSKSNSFFVSTSVSELARNIYKYAGEGTVIIKAIKNNEGKTGIEVICEDEGPGIENIELAMKDGYSSTGSLGVGLSGVKRMMDEFEIDSEIGKGTRVIVRKWR